MRLFAAVFLLATLVSVAALSQSTTPAQSVRGQFADINRKILDMAKDFPEDKYDFKLKPEMRTFGAVIVHIAGGNVYATKSGKGEKANWDELDPKDYKTKAQVVALMEKVVADSEATLKSLPDASFANTIEPWSSVTEHSAEHYGLLVAYYRANRLVPPESRPKKQ
jgi:hypothetical protein